MMFKLVLLFCAIACVFCYGSRLDGRIVGGEETTIEKFPYHASLRRRGEHICGAAIISEHILLSAGHCVRGWFLTDLSINAGVTNKYKDGQVIPLSCIALHPDYFQEYFDGFSRVLSDIAVLKLKSPLQWTARVAPIALPAAGAQLVKGEPVTITGWGAVWEGGPTASRLRVVTVSVIERKKCNKLYDGLITKRMFCAGLIEGGKDACQGDSGGPVVANGKLVGLVSWGKGCARPGYPGVYTYVSRFINWIHKQQNQLQNQ